jgi:hypothetical protein
MKVKNVKQLKAFLPMTHWREAKYFAAKKISILRYVHNTVTRNLYELSGGYVSLYRLEFQVNY